MSFANWTLSPDELFSMGPVVPVMVIEQLEDALPMAQALLAADIKVLEVTLRTPVALEAIQLLREELPDALVGAGTVTTPEQLQSVTAAGAQFAISPGITRELLVAGAAGSIPLLPGVATISELMQAHGLGYRHLKFFPAEAAGGTAMLKAIAGPFADVQFCPTGGIHQNNFRDYLALPNVRCVGGSWILPKTAIAAKNWPEITRLSRAARP
ncbi:bifunctional 4-hydroxy-2-oxoglutarate aldolase/2-dehydro-3-deoxy-phosphogluconate aldolase [Pseudidiomarina sp. 1APR75-33.1]|uniref:bifunctional 4-hydroxy-2-oxoglutarate aldolase/2-dehydro-3-deoxy-phosphogluconate aldolase n=1 Tax=Pseudidiomarina terrestris TaxID=2820060 RepID=UPI002656B57C|nr:bifunctional 4-hydroxy-2-oxoglutarate aldolase/2-dehydro-3-deoxy-phosphogluconate aldolase [Pseudidiomarina sp. 1APR75-33.1]MDN7127235.1 bifunctional 4-hydroxy-2-oxoglutarate aldolase/2-dehydro-3-deoxy-phosphogluconate aldolase [Pseudidiomarina sp. 1APR75-33.1]